jgi:hypothetical protein
LVLDKTIDATEAAVGDLIRAHVLQGYGDLPRGARIYGRVNRIINFNDQIPLPKREHPLPTPKQAMWGQHAGEVLIQIEFQQIEYRHRRTPFAARLIDVESPPGRQDAKILSFGYLDSDVGVRYDPPGTATLYLSQEKSVLGRGVIMHWVPQSAASPLKIVISHAVMPSG